MQKFCYLLIFLHLSLDSTVNSKFIFPEIVASIHSLLPEIQLYLRQCLALMILVDQEPSADFKF